MAVWKEAYYRKVALLRTVLVSRCFTMMVFCNLLRIGEQRYLAHLERNRHEKMPTYPSMLRFFRDDFVQPALKSDRSPRCLH